MAHRFQVNSLDVLGQREQPPPFVPSRKFRVNPFDLLGQGEIYPYPVHLPGRVQPKLTIAWNSFHQNFFSGIPVFFQRGRLLKGAPPPKVFRDCIIERPMPRRAILASFLLYVAALLMPWPDLPAAPLRNHAFDNTELTWSGRIEDLPLLNIPKQKSAAKAKSACAGSGDGRKYGCVPSATAHLHRPGSPHASKADSGESCRSSGSAEISSSDAQRGADCCCGTSAAADGDQ